MRDTACWSNDKLISDVLLKTPSHGRASVDQPARTYRQQLYTDRGYSLEDLLGATDDKDGWRESGKSVMLPQFNDDDDDAQDIFRRIKLGVRIIYLNELYMSVYYTWLITVVCTSFFFSITVFMGVGVVSRVYCMDWMYAFTQPFRYE